MTARNSQHGRAQATILERSFTKNTKLPQFPNNCKARVFCEFPCTTSSQLRKAQQLPEPISFLGRWGFRAGTTAQLELCEGLEETFIPPDTVTYCVGHNVIWVIATSLCGINSSSAGRLPLGTHSEVVLASSPDHRKTSITVSNPEKLQFRRERRIISEQ